MKLQLSELTTERKWRSATGIDKARFNNLLAVFKENYQERYGKSIEQKQASEKGFNFVSVTRKNYYILRYLA